jgi:hypothetical protein
MLKIRRMVIQRDGKLEVDTQSLDVLSYYANAIINWQEAGSNTSMNEVPARVEVR